MSIDKKSDFKTDIRITSWLSPFSQNSIKHVLKMALFYHVLGYAVMVAFSTIAVTSVPNYQFPTIPLSLDELITAGPIEETLFFGLPFYLSGNIYLTLGTGLLWSLIHLLNTDVISFANLNYATFFFVIPTLFFSFRAWRSGKGWLSILIHSGWNGIVYGLTCMDENKTCSIVGTNYDTSYSWGLIITSAFLMGMTYLVYRRRKNKKKVTVDIVPVNADETKLNEMKDNTSKDAKLETKRKDVGIDTVESKEKKDDLSKGVKLDHS